MEHTRSGIKRLIPRVGDSLLTNKRRPILTVLEDTCGVHDMLMSACDIYRYQVGGFDSSGFSVTSCSMDPISWLYLTQVCPDIAAAAMTTELTICFVCFEHVPLVLEQKLACVLDDCSCMANHFPSDMSLTIMRSDIACLLIQCVLGHARAHQQTRAWQTGILVAECKALALAVTPEGPCRGWA